MNRLSSNQQIVEWRCCCAVASYTIVTTGSASSSGYGSNHGKLLPLSLIILCCEFWQSCEAEATEAMLCVDSMFKLWYRLRTVAYIYELGCFLFCFCQSYSLRKKGDRSDTITRTDWRVFLHDLVKLLSSLSKPLWGEAYGLKQQPCTFKSTN